MNRNESWAKYEAKNEISHLLFKYNNEYEKQ